MSRETLVRPLRAADLDAVVDIDARVTGCPRPEYYRAKLAEVGGGEAEINASLVAESDGKVVGFLVGTLRIGEFCIPENSAVVDMMGVDPDCQDRGIGGTLFQQFVSNMRAAGVERVYTLVDWEDFRLLKFFARMKFVPSRRLSLEHVIE